MEHPATGASGNRVYVHNLSWSTEWYTLKDFMRSVGPVAHVEVLRGRDGRSKGCAIVEFETAAAAADAIRTLQDAEIDGRRIALREDRDRAAGAPAPATSKPSSGGVRVFVRNLDYAVSSEHLQSGFGEAGPVLHAEVLRNRDGKSKGCGIVEFATAEAAENAIAMFHGRDMDSRVLEVRLDRDTGREGRSGPPAAAAPRAAPAVAPAASGAAVAAVAAAAPPSPAAARDGKRPTEYSGDATFDSARLFVGNLSYRVTWRELKDHFRSVGEVKFAEVFTDGHRSKGCGIVEMDSIAAAQAAMRDLEGSILMDRQIHVRPDREPPAAAGAAGTAGAAGRRFD